MQNNSKNILNIASIDTRLGKMVAVFDKNFLYLLEFDDCKNLDNKLSKLKNKYEFSSKNLNNQLIANLRKELIEYFDGKLVKFNTPLYMLGSAFQKHVWQTLMKIPSGETRSYSDVASAIGRPMAFRAVANANGMNQLAIIIPCHRVIRANEDLGGYGGGVARKEWMLAHEKISDKMYD